MSVLCIRVSQLSVCIVLLMQLASLPVEHFSIQVKPNSAEQVRRHIEQAYLRENSAAQARDIRTSLKDTSPYWYMITPDGKRFTYTMLRKSLAYAYSRQVSVSSTQTLLHFVMIGQKAQVTIKNHTKQMAEEPGSHNISIITTNSLSIDCWKYYKTDWVLVNTKMLSFQMTTVPR